MKRFLLMLAVAVLPRVSAAQTTTLTFDDVTSPGLGAAGILENGFIVSGYGYITGGKVFGFGEGYPISVRRADGGLFSLQSVLLSSVVGLHEQINVAGLLPGDAYDLEGPIFNNHPPLFTSLTVEPNVFTEAVLDWSGLAAIQIDGANGLDPQGDTQLWGTFYADNFVVTATPEPASLTLVATGLLALAGVVRRRQLRS